MPSSVRREDRLASWRSSHPYNSNNYTNNSNSNGNNYTNNNMRKQQRVTINNQTGHNRWQTHRGLKRRSNGGDWNVGGNSRLTSGPANSRGDGARTVPVWVFIDFLDLSKKRNT